MSQQIPIANITGWENAQPKKALVKSMQDQGFLDEFPIIVTTTDDGVYRLLDGRRRTAAAAQAGLETVYGVISPEGAALTIIAHATRSENPVAELHAYQELQRAGLSEEQIARIGYATKQRVRKIAKLNNLVPALAHRVDIGEIAPGIAFQVAGLSPTIQQEMAAKEEQITGPVVMQYKSARRQAALGQLDDLFDPQPEPANLDEFLMALSPGTLYAILAEIPASDARFSPWRANVKRIAAVKPIEIDAESLGLVNA